MSTEPINNTDQPRQPQIVENYTWMTIREGCELTARPRTALHSWINVQKLPSRLKGRSVMVPKERLLELHSSKPIKPPQTSKPVAQSKTGETQEAHLTIATSKLCAHPLSAEIYGSFHGEEDALMESVRSDGILTPLLITSKNVVVAGGERLRVARALKLPEIPVRVLDLTDPLDIQQALIESNVSRDKKNEQKIREYRALKLIEREKAKKRKGTRTDLVSNLTPSDTGKSRDLAAVKVGWCGSTAEKGLKVLEAIERCSETGNMQTVEEVRTTLNQESVDAAYNKAMSLGWLSDTLNLGKRRDAKPEVRIRASFKKATSAAEKLAAVVLGDEIAHFTPLQAQKLKLALLPVLKWLDGLDPVEHAA